MAILSIHNLIIFAVFIVICAGVVWLQIKLSRTDGRWLGLILPTITLLIALLAAIGTLTWNATPSAGVWNTALHAITIFLVCNIPTIVLSGIYLHERDQIRHRAELTHMSVQDL
ncbi:hypothetical protein DSM100688_0884 [Bifidobacterium ramosum]|uniref:Uncharacterized protein n=1 Tax=Bifidobacterium ramosum TaxID=1798158 RepID=A0A6L4X351_9BIFI|nr:hypothetical protein [Bifidobacterium ramosum]KAB8288317.1 hypothetical protein DSM100688_0884 [Bifidobacterium ramosum]NEG71645.1 hypothetical protein [Bifidobacterium ramosum]